MTFVTRAAAALLAPARVLTPVPVLVVVLRRMKGDLTGGAGMLANPLLTTSGIPSGNWFSNRTSAVSALPLYTRTRLALLPSDAAV